ncbi:trypsin-like serine peptidase [Streptomyces sp. URMC 123]|uniref:trypsin-like serine peptidase n=1 Tax=Streptomyces sp. URMC 123 TaxID=3423403 RepID=UPI003F1CD242
MRLSRPRAIRRPAALALAAAVAPLLLAAPAGAAPAAATPVGAASTPATATATSAADAVATVSYSPAERRAALAHWTPERMRAVGAGLDLGPTGPLSKPWTGPAAMSTVGRLFFVNADGADTWCTATAVKSANRSVVMAAGHCVRRGASPVNTYTDLVFVPGYARGARPHGVFAVKATHTPRGWAEESTDDVAALVVDTAGGRSLTDAVGGQAIAFGRRPAGEVTAFGYPATRPQRGEELLHCTGTARPAPEPALAGEQRVPCDLSGGASGGPWLADFDTRTGAGTLVSVNSHGDALENSRHMYGPVLGAAARQVYDRAQRG